MGFFTNFPKTNYALEGNAKDVVNILTAALPQHLSVDQSYVFQHVIVSSGQRPEGLAEALYKEPNYYWTILVVNDIVNPYLGWPMADDELEDYVMRKYSGVPYGVHHFYNVRLQRLADDVDDAEYRAIFDGDDVELSVNGDVLITNNSDTILVGLATTLPEWVMPVTNLEYERDLNNRRKEIVVISPRFITQFVDAYNKALTR